MNNQEINPLAVLGTLNAENKQTVGSDKDLLKRMKKTAVYSGKTIKSNKL